MSTDVSNILSDLRTLSDNADHIISDINYGNDQIGQWFSIIKDTANAIVKNTHSGASSGGKKSSCFPQDNIPQILTLIQGKQNSRRVSAFLATQKDNRARLSHRNSRKSLRKIVLKNKDGNQWKISGRDSSVKNMEDNSTTPISKVKDKLLENQFKSPLSSSSNNYLGSLDSSKKKTPETGFCTPVESNEILVPDTDKKTPVIHSKMEFDIVTTEVKGGKKNVSFSQDISYEKSASNSDDPKESSDNETAEFLTPENKTIVVDSDGSAEKSDYTTPVTRSKRKSSAQHTQENAKKIKSNAYAAQGLSGKTKWKDSLTGKNGFKQIKLAKDTNSVIQVKNIQQQIQTHPEKRILREIQEKEKKVSQNARKLRSLQEKKIAENKKAREKKMEKASQQRKKIEKEKEERIRSRTVSKQENLQQMESILKKGAQKKVEPVKNPYKSQNKRESIQRPLRSPVKQKSPKDTINEGNGTFIYDTSPQEIANTNALNSTYVTSANVKNNSTTFATPNKAPPKPIRNAKQTGEVSSLSDLKANQTSTKEAIRKPLNRSPVKESALSKNKTSAASSNVSKYANNFSSTPTTKKIESKINSTKTPTDARKPNSYAMTPHESSFVSYDISEIKSDDESDDEESPHHKPVPTWASGISLRTALLNQYYSHIDVEKIFGNIFEPPILSEIMGMEKKHYHKRTSSAIWLESPNRSRSYYT